MTLQEAFDSFILSRQLAAVSPATVSAYRSFVLPFVSFSGPGLPVGSLLQEDISRYILSVVSRDLSQASRSTHIRHLKAFLHWMQTEYPVQYDFSKVRVPRSPKKNVRIYSPGEVAAIFSAVSVGCPWLSLRNKAMVALMYDSGLRLCELCSLRRSWISGSRLKVCGKGGKERVVPLGSASRQLIGAYLAACPHRSAHVFVSRCGSPVSPNAVKLMMSRAASALGFELSCHRLRHNFATNYCLDQLRDRHRVDVYSLMCLMGHEDLQTTERYLHHAHEIMAADTSVSHLDQLRHPGFEPGTT